MKEEEADPEDDDLGSKQFLRKSEQARWLGVNPRTITRIAERDPTFPPEIRLSETLLVRSRQKLEIWLQAQTQESSAPEGRVVLFKRGRGRPRKE
ncbi:hypothetical protein VAR608DRAFT_4932 [Variovorax sp. HW608]|uniref:hypothetical protein n=1 Tax=Variovorax sp. HW608 TaxID=1034889 RepID=UPI00081F7C62|nr:hypothetical protein [Variovorax sp. HW608]SCK49511.1 hypothetical protein VAR608DRAFT_4932 [Variovorax sp. HW608]